MIEPGLDPQELRAMLAAARQLCRARAGLIKRQISRLRAELAAITEEQQRIAITSLMVRRSIDPANPFRTAQIAADVADLLPPHPAIDEVLADRETEAAERASRNVLKFPTENTIHG
ncbi:hypothetical protein AruPA_15250 [Acidiphilium sp. PA]|uniref:hypothetical protein n=1 Tax=Acidiphilium sp. PA TaxID=2871705 RepID=UPI002243D2B7|nr:hypothetical protein [Acidiphilium sp. PA]MCW8308394.1 hypothetical protein [Acidiphilium sp. PA]